MCLFPCNACVYSNEWNKGPLCSYFCRQSRLKSSAYFIRELSASRAGLICTVCPPLSPAGRCVFVFNFHICRHKCECEDDVAMSAKNCRAVLFSSRTGPTDWLFFVSDFSSILALLEVKCLCLCDLEYESAPPSRHPVPVPFSVFWLHGWDPWRCS